MALSEDQRALLRLLLAGDTYERVADVLGTSAEDVRDRAHRAADVIEGEGDPELSAEAVNDRFAALEGAPVMQPSVPAAAAPTDPRRRRLVLWAIAAAGALVLLVVLLVVGIGGGGSDQDRTTSGGTQEEAVPVRLTPVGGSHASGGLTIVRVADQPAVDLDIRGLEPTMKGETYVLWLVGSGGRSLPVAFQAVGQNGRITGRTPIPTAAAGLLPSFDTAELTLTSQRRAAAAVQRAARSGTLPERVGTGILRGSLR
jgi:hypothetical protein